MDLLGHDFFIYVDVEDQNKWFCIAVKMVKLVY